MKAFLGRLWRGWKKFAHWLGDKQAIVVFSVLYFIIVAPIALALRWFWDPLLYRQRGRASFWIPRRPVAGTLEEVGRQ